MQNTRPRAAPDTPFEAMRDGEVSAVPVLAGGRISGIVTRPDLIAALARSRLPAAAAGEQRTPLTARVPQ